MKGVFRRWKAEVYEVVIGQKRRSFVTMAGASEWAAKRLVEQKYDCECGGKSDHDPHDPPGSVCLRHQKVYDKRLISRVGRWLRRGWRRAIMR